MRFKDWCLREFGSGGGAATSAMHGGLLDPVTAYTNVGMPVQSKFVTKDGNDKTGPDSADGKVSADRVFGFRNKLDKIRTKERDPNTIDTDRKRVPMEIIPPDTIYH